MVELFNYQRVAVDKLKENINKDRKNGKSSLQVLKAPTGAGKTVMLSALIDEYFFDELEDTFCVIWISPGKGDLLEQSYKSVNKNIGSGRKVYT